MFAMNLKSNDPISINIAQTRPPVNTPGLNFSCLFAKSGVTMTTPNKPADRLTNKSASVFSKTTQIFTNLGYN